MDKSDRPDDRQLENKRLRIINGAITVFSRKGFYKAKIEEIAGQAEVGKGTVYEYFSSKKELFQEMVLYIEERYEEMFRQELAGTEIFLDRLQKTFQVTMRFLNQHKEMARILLSGYPPVAEDTQKILLLKNRQKFVQMTKTLEEAIDRQEIRPVETTAAAQVILGALYFIGGQILFFEDENESNYEQLAKNVIAVLLQGLLK